MDFLDLALNLQTSSKLLCLSRFSPSLSAPPGGGGGQRHDLQLPRQPEQPDGGAGAELRLAPLHAMLPAPRRPAGLHAQPQVPGTAVPGGQPGHDGQPDPHLRLLNNGQCVCPPLYPVSFFLMSRF